MENRIVTHLAFLRKVLKRKGLFTIYQCLCTSLGPFSDVLAPVPGHQKRVLRNWRQSID